MFRTGLIPINITYSNQGACDGRRFRALAIHDDEGYVGLRPLGWYAIRATDHGKIALSLREPATVASGFQEHGGQYICSTIDAMNIARMLVRAVALADAYASAPKVPEGEKETRVTARACSPALAAGFALGRPAATIFF